MKRRITSLGLSFSLVLASFGLPGAQAIAVEIRATGGSAASNIQIVAPLNARSLPTGLGPTGTIGSISLKGSLAPAAIVPKPVVLHTGAQTADFGSLPAPAVAEIPAQAVGRIEAPPAGQERLLGAMGLAELPAEAMAPTSEQARSASASRGWAERSFSFLKGEGFGKSRTSDEPAVAAGSMEASPSGHGGSLKRWTVPALMASVGIGILTHPGKADSFTQQAEAVAAPLREAGVLEAIGSAGYAVGNFLAFLFPLPEIYKTIKEGHSAGAPLWRVGMLAVASLALGLINATVADKWFWGVQNLFGGLAILAIMPLGAWLSRKKAGSEKPLLGTVLVSAAVLALSVGLYFGAAAVVPGLLAQLFSAAFIPQLTLAVQIVTGIMYLLLFVPDIISLVKGTPPKGFTPAFSMMFFATSAAFVVWTAQMMLMAPTSAESVQFAVYLAQNILYSVVSLISYFVARKHAAKSAVPGVVESARPPPVVVEPIIPQPSIPGPQSAPVPASVDHVSAFMNSLPHDARAFSMSRLMTEKDWSQRRARKIAKDARLVSVAINLDDPRAHWIFIFHSNSKKRILTVWQKRIGVKTLSSSEPRTRVLWDSRMSALGDPVQALERLDASRPGFKPVRLEIRPRWKADPVYVFLDRKGRAVEVPLSSKDRP